MIHVVKLWPYNTSSRSIHIRVCKTSDKLTCSPGPYSRPCLVNQFWMSTPNPPSLSAWPTLRHLSIQSNGLTGNYLFKFHKSMSPYIPPIFRLLRSFMYKYLAPQPDLFPSPLTSVSSLKSSSHTFCIGPGGALNCTWLVSLCMLPRYPSSFGFWRVFKFSDTNV